MRVEIYSYPFLSLRGQQADSQLKPKSVWRHSAAVSSPKKDVNAAPTAANAVWIVARHYTSVTLHLPFPQNNFKPKLNKAGQERERDRETGAGFCF